MFSRASYPQIYSIMYEEVLPSASFPFSITTRWTCADWQRAPCEFSRCSAMLKPRGKTGWNCLVCLVSARSEESILAPGNSTNSRLLPLCRLRQTEWHGGRWPNSRSGPATLIWHVRFGKKPSVIHDRATRPMSSWRFITNARPATQSKLDKSSSRQSMNFVAQAERAKLRRRLSRDQGKIRSADVRLERKPQRRLLDAMRAEFRNAPKTRWGWRFERAQLLPRSSSRHSPDCSPMCSPDNTS